MARRRTQQLTKAPGPAPRIPGGLAIPRPISGPGALRPIGTVSQLPRPTPLPFDGSRVPLGWAALVSPNAYVMSILGDAPVNVTDGYGGWEVIARARRVGFTEYAGQPPLSMSVPLLIDSFLYEGQVETVVTVLESMALGKGNEDPPTVRIYGAGIPHREKLWVVSGIDWGAVEFSNIGARSRQALTVSLLEFVTPDNVVSIKYARRIAPKKVDCKKAKSRVKRYTWRRGDTIQKVSAKYLGSALPACYNRILALNKIRNPKTIRVNQVIRLP